MWLILILCIIITGLTTICLKKAVNLEKRVVRKLNSITDIV